MKKLRIEFQKVFNFDMNDQDEKQCHCELTVVLPTDEKGEVVDLLRAHNKWLFGSPLSFRWGDRSTDIGKGSQIIRATDWDKLSRLVDHKIDEIVDLLKEVKERPGLLRLRNERLLSEKPKNESIVVEI